MNMNVLDEKVSLFENAWSNEPMGEISLYDFLRGESYRKKWQPLVEQHRMATKSKQSIPAVTVSGVFEIRNANKLKEHSGLICIDIDAKDNDFLQDYDFYSLMSCIPHVAYCGHSVGGKGYFVIIPIPICDPRQHKKHFEALRQDFSSIGINIDIKCGDVSRLRVYTYDSDAYINTDANTYENFVEIQRSTKARRERARMNSATFRKAMRVISKIVKTQIDITDDYGHWLALASAFYNEFGESGRDLFHIVSRVNTAKYNEARTDKQFDNVAGKPYPYTIGTFFKYAKDAGIDIR